METIQMQVSQKQNVFSEFFSAFSESALNFEHFQKKMTLIAYVFPNLPTIYFKNKTFSLNLFLHFLDLP